MKKFLLLFHGWEEPTPEVMQAWGAWFGTVGDAFVDSGNPFRGGLEVTKTGSTTLTPEMKPAVAYSIVNAPSLDDAEKLLDGCPIIDSVRIYEAVTM
jgi:hypothetical protein